MRITKKTNLAQMLIKINKRQQSSFTNNTESNNNNRQSLLQKSSLIAEEPIKVQLVKNNNNKKIYSTKTIDIKTLYNNQMNINIKNNDNDDMNKNITNKRKMSSTDLQKINFKNPTEFKDYNNQQDNSNNINNDKNFNKGIKTQYKYSSNINSPRVISAFNSYNSNNIVEDNQSKHKIHDLLSHKFLYNKPKTSSNLNNNNIKKNPYPYDLKTYYNNNYNNINLNNVDNISVNSFNINRKEKMRINKDNLSAISSDDAYTLIKNYNYYNNININNNVGINIKLDDLIICDEKLNDILIALNNNNKNYEMDASNECAEFYVFFFHSTLQNIFNKFYNEKKKIIIDSANNLTLLSIIITYHLSLNKDILKDVINIIINILKLLRINLYLNVKKIQIFFGNTFVEKNKFYFKTFNYYLNVQNLINLNEEEIIMKIDRNCRIITSELKKILKIYQQMNEPYHNDFVALFNNISIISETDFKDYFYARLYNKINIRNKNRMKQNKSTKKENDEYDFNYNDMNSNLIDNCDVISVKSNKSSHYYGKIDKHNFKILKLLEEYEKNKIEAPFIREPSNKKYTIVLDLDETLINIEFKELESNKCILHFRPGLFSFLTDIKPFCELITFTSASKEYAQPIINEIELKHKYFDYNFFREHSIIYGNDFVKDISRIGRDMKKIIIVDNMKENFRLNLENGIKIAPFNGDINDNILYELKNLIISFYQQGYEDLTLALHDYSNEIKTKISLEA